MSDLGYFGPDSVTWRIHSEPVAMVGGLRALLLQALHPGAMQLLYERSNFRDDPWARFERTATFVGVVCFAPTAEVDAAAEQVRAVHRMLGIDDPEQLAWVHACLVGSFLAAARAAGLRLRPAERDAYVHEQALAAALVGVEPERTPTTTAELQDLFAEIRPRLAGTPEARAAARFVVAPPMPVPRRFALPARLGGRRSRPSRSGCCRRGRAGCTACRRFRAPRSRRRPDCGRCVGRRGPCPSSTARDRSIARPRRASQRSADRSGTAHRSRERCRTVHVNGAVPRQLTGSRAVGIERSRSQAAGAVRQAAIGVDLFVPW